MLDQLNFDRSEDIAEALHEQRGLEIALLHMLADNLPAEIEQSVFALINAQGYCRQRAQALARGIAVSGTGDV